MDLAFLSHLYAVTGPYATVYVDTPRAAEDAKRVAELGWRGLREQLAAEGADEETLAAMDPVFDDLQSEADGRCVVAAQGRVLLDHRLPGPPRRPEAYWGPLPHVMPLVAALHDAVPYVLVIADRTGADITAYAERGRLFGEGEVEGETVDLRLTQAGGWSQRRYRNRSENVWEANSKEVAEQVGRIARQIDAKVIVAAGDVRALQLLRENLEAGLAGLLVTVDEGGRAAGASEEALDRRVEAIVAEVAAQQALAVAERFAEEIGQRDKAVEGLAAVVEVVRKAQVQCVVLLDDPSSTATLWIGEDPVLVATTAKELHDLGVEAAVETRADAALLRALVGTAADLVVIPGGPVLPAEDIGALLRYADAATPV